MIKTIIIEDEVNSQNYIKKLLKVNFPEVRVLECLRNLESSKSSIENHKPDLIFLDIDIIGGNGFELLDNVSYLDFEIIFITAYCEFSIQAIKKNAVDYILKPFDDDEFTGAVKKALSRISIKIKLIRTKKIKIISLGNTILLDQKDIMYLQASRGYTIIITNNDSIMSTKNLGEYETVLGNSFFRCHHSFIVNLNFIQKIEKKRNGNVILNNGEKIPVSQRKISLLNKLNN